ncbi:MAG: amidase [Acidimicrobiales bacterium]
MTVNGSQAHQAFAEARAQLDGYRADPACKPPGFRFVPERYEGDLGVVAPVAPDDAPAKPINGLRSGDDTIVAAAARIACSEQSCSELLADALVAVDKYDSLLNGVVALDAERALEVAGELDRELADGHCRGPLHGIPITVKDIIDVAGLPTCAGSDAYADAPGVDAAGVARLRKAGAIILAKVTTHEFALGVTTPQSRNPHDPSRIPGGSSGGSAIAVATGMSLGSLGTDTRASIRVPAALSGVVGFKATFGAIPTQGVVPLSWTMDHVAPMARTVHDTVLMLDALMDGPGLIPFVGASVKGMRVGTSEAAFAGCEPEVELAVHAGLGVLADLGCRVGPSLQPTALDLDLANAAGLIVSRSEAATFHRSLGLDRSRYWQEVAEQLEEAEGILAMDYLDAQRVRVDLGQRLMRAFDTHDVLAMPTSIVVAPPVEDFARYLTVLSRNAIPWSFLGFPALSVPCGMTPQGLPVGLQLVAPPGCEARLVALGTAYEGAL